MAAQLIHVLNHGSNDAPYGTPPIDETHVCYGTVSHSIDLTSRALYCKCCIPRFFLKYDSDSTQIIYIAIRLCGNLEELNQKLAISSPSLVPGHTLLQVFEVASQFFIAFEDGMMLGEVNLSLRQALNNIAKQQCSPGFEVFAPVEAIRQTTSTANERDTAVVHVQIYVYGPRNISQVIGQELSRQKFYLQRPDYIREGVDYDNPQEMKFVNDPSPLSTLNKRKHEIEKFKS
jgi:hypothetical protein